MARLSLTYGGCDYWDRSHSLIDGTVRPRGIDLNYLTMSLSTFVALAAQGDSGFVGVPVFPSRNFRHGYLFVNTRAGIDKPDDLRGRRVGVPEYQMTAALWIRGFLQHDFGVQARDVVWLTGGMRKPGYVERAPIALPDDIRLSVIPEDRHLEGMLDAGDIEAMISPVRPASLVAGQDTVRRMFPDSRTVEKDYYRRTRLFPIMHTIVIRRAVYEKNPWVALSLFEAFEEAKRLGRARLEVTGPLAVALPWVPSDLEEIVEVFGDVDPWAYGIGPNRHCIETLCRYSHEQGLAGRVVDVEELFARETFVPPAVGEAA